MATAPEIVAEYSPDAGRMLEALALALDFDLSLIEVTHEDAECVSDSVS
ncbi:MAG TPA: hypothetical protein VMM84_14575 [Pyrinomonadaceae bacterium]|nr:hypothetical protein [Pyrinomonadaceae bacterium]